jgi:8-oxo-dGTP pyrophosphatase MutT (NUDIX family)
MNKNNICNNCGKQGHQFHQCKLPIISYGMIVFRCSEKGIQYLMIRRKNSFGYIDFIRGKYSHDDLEHLETIFNEMSIDEKELIKNNDFETLWKIMWNIQEKGVLIENEEMITLDKIIDISTTKWTETEWEFPKGRRNLQEKDLECALREFEEETGHSKKDIKVVENVLPFEEMFLGSNHKAYKHKYFLGYTENYDDNLNNYQRSEVSKIEWKTLDECLNSIRPYNLEKKKLITNINKVLQEYRLY